MNWKLYIDGNEMQSVPVGLNELTTRIERDQELKGLFVKVSSELIFIKDAYKYLKDLFDNSGYCQIAEVRLDIDGTPEIEGAIILSDLSFDLQNKQVTATIADNNYFTKIYNNRKLKALLNAGRSKNDVDISSFVNVVQLEFSTSGPPGNVGPFSNRNSIKIYDAFAYLIAYMTDNEVAFESETFGTGGTYELNAILTGSTLNGATSSVPEIDFETLFREVDKRFNIGIAIDVSAATPTVRIEQIGYFYEQQEAFNLGDVLSVTMKLKTDLLYSKLKIGSTQTDFETSVPEQMIELDFLTWKAEEYAITGKCNIDNELDLVGEWIVDSNIIQDVTVNGNEDYADDVFLVNYRDQAGTLIAQRTQFDPTGVLVYNYTFFNSEIAKRYLGAVPDSIAKFLGDGDDEFEARNDETAVKSVTSPATTIEPLTYDDVVSGNTSGQYNVGGSYFEAPLDGIYTFELFSSIYVSQQPSGGLPEMTLELVLYEDSTFANELSSELFNITLSVGGSFVTGLYEETHAIELYMSSGNAVRVRLIAGTVPAGTLEFYTTNSHLALINSVSGGGIYQVYNPEDYKVLLYEFTHPLTLQQMRQIFANPAMTIGFNTCDGPVSAWHDVTEYNYGSGMTEWKVIKSQG